MHVGKYIADIECGQLGLSGAKNLSRSPCRKDLLLRSLAQYLHDHSYSSRSGYLRTRLLKTGMAPQGLRKVV